LYDRFHKKIYLVIVALDILACVHSGARSSFLFVLVAIFVCFLLHIKNPKRIIEFIKNTIAITLSLVIIVCILSLISQKCQHYYKAFGKSLLNTIGFDYNLDTDESEEKADFGSNKNGTMSRIAQFSGISYVAKINPVWGLGSGAQNRGDIRYYFKGMWRQVYSYDVGYVEIFCDEGLWGWFGYLSLFISLFIILLSGKYVKKDSHLSQYLIVSTVIYLLCLLSSSTIGCFLFTFVVLIFSSVKREESVRL
ncbi:MAG: O-antigen ligase family protein, partial [Lachnospiraceae bacterium]|nr:O-antigen ligase family protein [Lachnospiraceae bacterium]